MADMSVEGIIVENLSPCSLCFNLGVCDTAEDNCAPGPSTPVPSKYIYGYVVLVGAAFMD